ncbi:MAG: hypothetical protein AB8F78_19880 [Saprospiraceae bacterium]
MRTQNTTALLNQRLNTPRETTIERREREQKSLKVAAEMLKNGCCSNTVARYTGLSEDTLRQL